MNDPVKKILDELRAHPKEKEGYAKEDFDQLNNHQRALLIEPFVDLLSEGAGEAVEPLQWLLRERYVPELEMRLKQLPEGAHGLVFLPYRLYGATGDRTYLNMMMREIVQGDPAWDGRESALAVLKRLIGKEALFWDFCRYLILNDRNPAMKKSALLRLAQAKDYPRIELGLDDVLNRCLQGILGQNVPSPEARAILDRLHADAGTLKSVGLSGV